MPLLYRLKLVWEYCLNAIVLTDGLADVAVRLLMLQHPILTSCRFYLIHMSWVPYMTLTPLLTLTHCHQVKDDFIILQNLSTWTFSFAILAEVGMLGWRAQVSKFYLLRCNGNLGFQSAIALFALWTFIHNFLIASLMTGFGMVKPIRTDSYSFVVKSSTWYSENLGSNPANCRINFS
jgi:hypothetical protein